MWMIKRLESIMLSSDDSKKLGEFYKDVVGLTTGMVFEGPEGPGYEFPDVGIFVNPHSEVHGINKMPGRHILNFAVKDIEKEVVRLIKNGAKQTQEMYEIEGYGKIATFEDPDGNFFQLVEVKIAQVN